MSMLRSVHRLGKLGLESTMVEISRDELRQDMRMAFKEVLTDKELLEHIFEPFIARIVLEKMTDKFERTLGVDCTDHEAREETRKDMEFLRETRIWARSDEGENSLKAFKKLMRVVDIAAANAVKGVVYLLFAGAAALIALGIATHKSVKVILGI